MSVTGQAGIGKTRLAWELLKYVDGLSDTVFWHEGRCPAYGDGITFWALGEMVRARAGLLETDDEATTRRTLAETVAAHVPDADERRWIEPALLALLGIGTSAAGPEQLFGAWRTFFERLAAVAPVVMVFEDLQHADAGLLDFIDHLLEWSRGVPIYVLTLARPELLERRPGWGAARRDFASLHLEELPEAAMRELLAGLVPGLPEAAVRAIVGRADGVPLYAVETVRMLLDDAQLVASDGAYRPASDLGTIAVPESLTELIAARLDALDAADRVLLLDAAVLGQSFTTAALAAVSGIPSRISRRACGALSGGSSLLSRATRAAPSGASTPSSNRWSARSPTTRSRGATGRFVTSPPPASSRASGATRWPVPSPATISPPTGARPGERSPTPSPPRHASPCGRPPTVPRTWAPTRRP